MNIADLYLRTRLLSEFCSSVSHCLLRQGQWLQE
jgi:hypothetical protein